MSQVKSFKKVKANKYFSTMLNEIKVKIEKLVALEASERNKKF